MGGFWESERCRENRRERLVAVPKLGPKILGYDQFARASLLKLGEWELPRISAASREVCWAIKAGQAAVVDYRGARRSRGIIGLLASSRSTSNGRSGEWTTCTSWPTHQPLQRHRAGCPCRKYFLVFYTAEYTYSLCMIMSTVSQDLLP